MRTAFPTAVLPASGSKGFSHHHKDGPLALHKITRNPREMQVRFIFNLDQNGELFFGYNMHMTTNTIEQHRFNMIEQQIRTWEVLDPEVLDLLHQVPREKICTNPIPGCRFCGY